MKRFWSRDWKSSSMVRCAVWKLNHHWWMRLYYSADHLGYFLSGPFGDLQKISRQEAKKYLVV